MRSTGYLRGSRYEHQIFVSVSLCQKRSAKTFWFDYHDSSTKLLDIPIHCRITNEFFSHKFDLTRFIVEEHTVASLNLFARLIGEWHCRIFVSHEWRDSIPCLRGCAALLLSFWP